MNILIFSCTIWLKNFDIYKSCLYDVIQKHVLELVSKELNHLAAILHVYAGGLIFMK